MPIIMLIQIIFRTQPYGSSILHTITKHFSPPQKKNRCNIILQLLNFFEPEILYLAILSVGKII